MSKTLREIQSKFGHSRAIFAKSNVYKDRIELICIGPYDPKSADLDHEDPAVKLMVHHYRDHFDKKSLFTVCDGVSGVLNIMLREIIKAYVNASTLKSPQQSKLYKWLQSSVPMDNPSVNEGIVSLFRYIYKHVEDGCRFKNGPENPHAKNLVAILEKMKEKYE